MEREGLNAMEWAVEVLSKMLGEWTGCMNVFLYYKTSFICLYECLLVFLYYKKSFVCLYECLLAFFVYYKKGCRQPKCD